MYRILSHHQGRTNQSKVAATLEMEGSENPTLLSVKTDPTLFCTGYKKNRFYMFSRRGPDDLHTEADRDVFNEKPSKEDIISATEGQGECTPSKVLLCEMLYKESSV